MVRNPLCTASSLRGGTSSFRSTIGRFLTGTAIAVAASATVVSAAPPNGAKEESVDWKIEIRPLETSTAAVSVTPPAMAEQPGLISAVTAAPGVAAPRLTYAQAMASIPFNREEYEANPSYRHDAALEMMFGTMRPTMVVKQNIPYFSRYPDFFRNRFQIYPYPHGQGPSMNTFSNWTMNTYSY